MNYRKVVFIYTIILFYVFTCYSQGEGNNWYFGAYAGISWNNPTFTPEPIYNSPLSTIEGVATISNANGDLLFFTDGSTVWDANMYQMPNGSGLHGDPSSTQSAIIIPKPQDPNTYYIFTVPRSALPYGLCYTRVDMTANGGLGDIDTLEKNVQLFSPSPEKITAVRHSNGVDIWVIGHEWGSNNFRSYLITNSPINVNNYVLSSTGSVHFGIHTEFIGNMKTSTLGNKIALAMQWIGFEVCDFDNATGVVSNAVSIPGYMYAYGVEFSPDEHYLYGTCEMSPNINRWDLSQLPSAINLISSHEIVGLLDTAFVSGNAGGSCQLGPDNKMYFVRVTDNWVACLEDPCSANPTLILDAVNVDNPQTLYPERCLFGLPAFISSLFEQQLVQVINSCYNDSTYFSLAFPTSLDSVKWNMNYPAQTPQYQITQIAPLISDTLAFLYPSGTFTMQCIRYSGNFADTTYETFEVGILPVVDLGSDTAILCEDDVLNYDLSNNIGCTFLWTADLGTATFTDTLPTIEIDKPGLYVAYVSNSCGTVKDSIKVEYNDFVLNLGADILNACSTNPLIIDATIPLNPYSLYPYYIWNTGSTDQSIEITQSGTYSVSVTAAMCTEEDEITVMFDSPLNIDLGSDFDLCIGETDTIFAGLFANSYLWNTGCFNSSLEISAGGTYSVTVSNGCGSFADEITITQISVPVVDLGGIASICNGAYITLNAENPNSTYLWNSGSTFPSITVDTAGIFSVYVENQCGTTYDEISLTIDSQPILELGQDTIICPDDTIVLDAGNSGMDYLWSTQETTQTIDVTNAGFFSVTVSNACGTEVDYIEISEIMIDINLGNDTLICEGDSITINVYDLFSDNYLWNTGFQLPALEIFEKGIYSVSVVNICGETAVDSIEVLVFQSNSSLSSDTSFCDGASITLDAGFSNLSYSWIPNGETNQTIDINNSGIFEVTIYHPVCGHAEISFNVSIDPIPDINFEADSFILFPPATVILDAGSGFNSYVWSNNAITQSIEVSEQGMYCVLVCNEFGCCAIDSVFVILFSGMKNIENSGINIFPNPTNSNINIEINLANSSDVYIQLYDTQGKLLNSKSFNNLSSEKNDLIYYLEDYEKGIYILNIRTDSKSIIKKIIKE